MENKYGDAPLIAPATFVGTTMLSFLCIRYF